MQSNSKLIKLENKTMQKLDTRISRTPSKLASKQQEVPIPSVIWHPRWCDTKHTWRVSIREPSELRHATDSFRMKHAVSSLQRPDFNGERVDPPLWLAACLSPRDSSHCCPVWRRIGIPERAKFFSLGNHASRNSSRVSRKISRIFEEYFYNGRFKWNWKFCRLKMINGYDTTINGFFFLLMTLIDKFILNNV